MTTASVNKLTQMVKDAPDQSAGLSNAISSVTSEITDLSKQKAALTDGVCGTSESELVDYLENVKLPEISIDSTSEHRVQYGASFGTIDYVTGNISDWAIQKLVSITPTPPPILPPVPTWVDVYVYQGVGWDDDETITQLITDYAFGNDYIERPLTSGATYGLTANISTLNSGKSILQTNKAKVDSSVDVLSRYI